MKRTTKITKKDKVRRPRITQTGSIKNNIHSGGRVLTLLKVKKH